MSLVVRFCYERMTDCNKHNNKCVKNIYNTTNMAASLSHLRLQLRKPLLLLNPSSLQDKLVFYSSLVAKDLNATKSFALASNDVSEIVEYPAVKPQYPPGKWGEMDSSYAWLWQKTIEELMTIPDVKGRQDAIANNEMSHLHTLPYNDHPNYLEFAKFATKTAFYPWSEVPDTDQTSLSSADSDELDNSLMKKIKNLVIDQILIEQDYIERDKFCKTETSHFPKRQAGLIMRCISDTMITNLSEQANHLRTCQYDEDVIVRAIWDRHGIERMRKHKLGPNHFKMDKVLDHRLLSSCVFNGMIRSHLPLPKFQPRDGGLSITSEIPVLPHKFSSYGVRKMSSQKLKSILAGHILGDPCEYGLIGFLLTNDKRQLDTKYGTDIAKECRLGRGLMATFTWLAAQAYNQGFSGFIDLTYPLTSQTILSDGQNFSFLACQLNTLELWKSDSANEMVNLCWYSDEMPLYECIENGQVKGFNDDVLKMMIQMFKRQPADRGYDMKPTISDKEINMHEKYDFIPEKMEEVVEEKEEQYIV